MFVHIDRERILQNDNGEVTILKDIIERMFNGQNSIEYTAELINSLSFSDKIVRISVYAKTLDDAETTAMEVVVLDKYSANLDTDDLKVYIKDNCNYNYFFNKSWFFHRKITRLVSYELKLNEEQKEFVKYFNKIDIKCKNTLVSETKAMIKYAGDYCPYLSYIAENISFDFYK